MSQHPWVTARLHHEHDLIYLSGYQTSASPDSGEQSNVNTWRPGPPQSQDSTRVDYGQSMEADLPNIRLNPPTASTGAYPSTSPLEPPRPTSTTTPIDFPTSSGTQSSQQVRQNVTLVQLGASHHHTLRNQPAPWIQALDVDRSYRPPRTPSPSSRPALCLYVRIPDYEPYHRALYLRERTVPEFIRCVAEKYGLNAGERERIRGVVLRTPIGTEVVDDDDVSALRDETQMYLRCAPVRGEADVWQLELS